MVWVQGSLRGCGADRDATGVVTAGVWEARVLLGSVAQVRLGCYVWAKTLHQDVAERGFQGFPSGRVSTRHEIVY